ncbi:uncharacterized protein LOC111049031 [Nilaparvata lugens]|uniref:uncharacterized protein LOC111049031 n=1 Tax=Nilaparvata lugens TaxID=108931 RepID=UPI00193DD54C|nr:uncharacterized protein LOC111049031 [Nilaparvata lugens]
MNPRKLYSQCLEVLAPILEKLGGTVDWDENPTTPLDKLAAVIVEDLLFRVSKGKSRWNESWRIFLTPKIRYAVLALEESLLKFAADRCKALRRVCFPWCGSVLDPKRLSLLPPSVTVVDFDVESHDLDLSNLGDLAAANWLPEATLLHRSLWTSRRKAIEGSGLTEVHLTGVSVTAQQLTTILEQSPCLRVLQHYQLVRALYNMHAQQWKRNEPTPKYKLLNLDADFSHIIRSHMSPLAVLPCDALRLASILCPEACYIRLRYDPMTPNDILQPLTSLKKMREFSAVCVSSGERCVLDFTDMAPIIEHHGPKSLLALELKVIEEVDPHVILLNCPKLESLVLSGCGFNIPASCPSHGCSEASFVLPCPRLRLLFYADGDDFSWTHHMPQCFWRATLNPRQGHGKRNRLKGLFMESPRIWDETATYLWSGAADGEGPTTFYPELTVVSLCRYPEINIPQLQAALKGAPLRYLRSVTCDKLHAKRMSQLFSSSDTVVNAECEWCRFVSRVRFHVPFALSPGGKAGKTARKTPCHRHDDSYDLGNCDLRLRSPAAHRRLATVIPSFSLFAGHGKRNRLKGLFMESPRIWDETATYLWSGAADGEGPTTFYPELTVVSLCRYPEINIPQLQAALKGAPLRYLRSVTCDKLHAKRMSQLFSSSDTVVNAE